MAFRCDCCMFTYDNVGLLCNHLRAATDQCSSSSLSPHVTHAFVCTLCAVSSSAPCAAAAFAGARAFADHLDAAHADTAAVLPRTALAQPRIDEATVSSAGGKALRKTAADADEATLLHCTHCARPFKRAWDLKRHLRTHTDERPFVCDACGRRFRLRTTLADHWRTHEEAETHATQFQCSACAKRFLSRSALKLHMRTHTGEAPFRCPERSCSRTFRTKKLMLTHRRNDHCSELQQLFDEEQEEDAAQRFEREATCAFVALARLNRRTANRGGPAATVINRSEQSAFSNFQRHNHQQQQQHQSQHSNVQQELNHGSCR
uniref:C2H2-type domain-containing protein n=1 Tax=Globodera rostochiensis TaxID=31243 RepID=A0A914I1P6_GLORO